MQPRHVVDGVESAPLGLLDPELTDVFIGSEVLECLEPPGDVVGVQEVGEVRAQPAVAVVVVAAHGRLLNRTVHAVDLSVGPRVVGLGQAVLDAVLAAAEIEHVGRGGSAVSVAASKSSAS